MIVGAGAIAILIFLGAGIENIGGWWTPGLGGLLRIAYDFFGGVLLYQIWIKRPPRFTAPAPAIALALAVVLFAEPPEAYQMIAAAMTAFAVFPFLIWLGASAKPGMALSRLCSIAGDISYAIYVLHLPPLGYIAKAHVPRTLLNGIIYVVALVTIAYLAHRWFDLPVRRRLMAWLASRPQAA
jgi:peptidoglycan/LPS O-acetylase OafA/YrhL